MKTIDRLQQRILGITKKQLQIVKQPKRFYYYDDSLFLESKQCL